MDKIEMGKLLVQISAIDNRQVTEATVEMWWRVNGDLEYSDAEQAVPLAFRDSKVGEYFSPQLLRAMVKRIREERAVQAEHDNRLSLEANAVVSPPPLCREHGIRIDNCVDCRALIGDNSHDWCVVNLYSQEPF